MNRTIEARRSRRETAGPRSGTEHGDASAARPVSLLLLAAWFGLVAGVTEVGLRLVQRFVLDERISLSRQFVWMTPLADVIVYAGIGVLVALAARVRPSRVGAGAVVFICGFAFVAAPLLVFERLHPAAVVLVAAGAAYQAALLGRRRTAGLFRLARVTALPLVVLVAVLAAWVNIDLRLDERSRVSALPAATGDRPNVLLIILDTVRAASLRLYGYDRSTTPNLDRFAAGSIVFDRAIAPAPWTLPSHASMFTGHFPDVLDADWKSPLGPGPATLAETLAQRGYRTGGFSGNVLYATYETGLERGFTRFEDYPLSAGMVVASSFPARLIATRLRDVLGVQRRLVHRSAASINRGVLSWLDEEAGRDRPFFAFVNYFDAHDPYVPPAPFDTMFGGIRPGEPLSFFEPWTAEELQAAKDAYDASIAYVDHELGRLLEALDRRALLDNTIVVIASDHGEHFGEHDLAYHANSLYQPLLHVPLLIRLPGGRAGGRRVGGPVSLADLPATILNAAGFGDAGLAGTPLVGRDGSTPAASPRVARAYISQTINMAARLPASRGDMASVTEGSLHYIRNGDGTEELYDFVADPLETRDLAASDGYGEPLARMRGLLKREEREAAAPLAAGGVRR